MSKLSSMEVTHSETPQEPAKSDDTIQRAITRYSSNLKRQRLQIIAAQIILVVGTLAVWELASGRLFDDMFVSRPSVIISQLYIGITHGDLLQHVQYTASEAVIGFLAGSVVAIALAIAVVVIPRGYEVIQPIAVAIYGIPKVALAPLFVIWFGLGIASKVAIAGFMVFFIVFLSTMDSLIRVSPGVIKAARVLGASRADILWKVNIPSAIPGIFTSFRLAVPISMIGAVVGEFISAQKGLGFFINRATLGFNTGAAFGGVFLLMLIVLLMNGILTFVDNRVLPWRKEQNSLTF